ncbi:MAG: AMP-binding protein [Thermodesulfobacteriota bacterium]
MISDTLPALIKSGVKGRGVSILLQKKDGWSWKQITWKDFESDVKSVCAFILDAGITPGNKILFESTASYDGMVSETAALMLGTIAISTAPSANSAAPALPEITAAFVKNRETAQTLSARHPNIKKAVHYSAGQNGSPDSVVTDFRAVLKFGFLKKKKMTDALEDTFSAVSPSFAAIEIYNGAAKPVSLTQGGFMRMVVSAAEKAGAALEESQTFCLLPRGDMFSRAAKFIPLCASARTAGAECGDDFLKDVAEVMPTVLFVDSESLKQVSSEAEKIGAPVFGGRLRHIFTDSEPPREVADFYSKLGIRVSGLSLCAGGDASGDR